MIKKFCGTLTLLLAAITVAHAAPVITMASVSGDPPNQLLTLQGSGFTGTATVLIGSMANVSPVSQSDSQLVFNLPQALAAGTYALSLKVAAGSGARDPVAFDDAFVTVGTVGCPGSLGGGIACFAPRNLGVLLSGDGVTIAGVVPAGRASEAWFVVLFNPLHGSPKAYLDNAAVPQSTMNYTVDFFADCSGRPVLGGTLVGDALPVYVRVRPLTTNLACYSYGITFSD